MARTDLRISDELFQRVKQQAEKHNRSLNGELCQLIEQGLLLDTVYRLPNGDIISISDIQEQKVSESSHYPAPNTTPTTRVRDRAGILARQDRGESPTPQSGGTPTHEVDEYRAEYIAKSASVDDYTGLAAGPPIEMNERVGKRLLPLELLPRGKESYFTIEVSGTSMSDIVQDGQRILACKFCGQLTNGGLYVFRINNTSTFKKLSIEQAEDGTLIYYQVWCDGSGRTQRIDNEDWAIMGEFVVAGAWPKYEEVE